MKYSTFYKTRGVDRVYTTIKNTDLHEHLRLEHEGKTYLHSDKAALFFCIGIPLKKPIGKNVRGIN